MFKTESTETKSYLGYALNAGFVLLLFLFPITSATALLTGIAFSFLRISLSQPLPKKISKQALPLSVALLGAAVPLEKLAQAGLSGIGMTAASISITLFCGYVLGKFFQLERETSILVSMGTAICGGSAIAATTPVIRARSDQASLALACVFVLNAVGLVLFPYLGHLLHLTDHQFGVFAALAIHDTSSVVGATLKYSSEALKIGTTVKLARALYIVPIVIGLAHLEKRREKKSREKLVLAGTPEPLDKLEATATPAFPFFILGFIGLSVVFTFLPRFLPEYEHPLSQIAEAADWIAKKGMVFSLFFIGSSLEFATLKKIGPKAFAQAILLWVISIGTSFVIIKGIAPS